LLLLLFAAGCIQESPDYPIDKPGTWRLPEVSANEANLRTMVVDPNDLIAGRGESTTIGIQAGPPAQRLFTGQRYPLPPSNVIELNITNGQQQQAPAPQGGAGVQ
jgi:hypothetical protein